MLCLISEPLLRLRSINMKVLPLSTELSSIPGLKLQIDLREKALREMEAIRLQLRRCGRRQIVRLGPDRRRRRNPR